MVLGILGFRGFTVSGFVEGSSKQLHLDPAGFVQSRG